MRFAIHLLHEGFGAPKKEKTPEEKEAEEKEKSIAGFVKMLMKAAMPSQLNMIVQQVAPLYVKWGDDWLDEFDGVLKEVVSDRFRNEFIKIVKNQSVRFHHIKNTDTGEAPADEIDAKRKEMFANDKEEKDKEKDKEKEDEKKKEKEKKDAK